MTPLDLKGKVDRQAVDAIEAFVRPHVGTGRFIVTLTGEHTGALGAIRAHARRYPTSECRADRCARRSAPCIPGQSVQPCQRDGARRRGWIAVGASRHSVDLSGRNRANYRARDRISTFFAAQLLDPAGPYEGKSGKWIPDVVKACRGPVYLTFDCDGLDASLVPALGTPEPGGLGWYDTLNLVTALANGPGILGMDISEIAPIEGFVAPQFCIARLIYRILGRVRAGRRVH